MHAVAPQKPAGVPSSSQSTVYVVDDDPGVRKSLRWLIETLNVPVQTFASADEFLTAYQPKSPGCLVVDVVMPGMSGLELQQELRRRGDDIPIIVLTAYGSVHSAVDALKNGAVDFLEKPFDDNVLLEQIRKSLVSVVRRHSERGQREAVRARMALLSRREREVLVHVVEGLSSKEIAVRLNVNFKTIEAHRARIMLKMEADCVAQLVRMVVDANADRDSRQP